MKFNERLKKLRTDKGLTQEELANALDIPSSTIRRLETDSEGLPRRERLEAIADFFGVTIDYLIGRTDDPRTHSLSAHLSGRSGFYANATVESGVGRQDIDNLDNGNTIITRESDRNYTVVARSKNLPPEKIEKLEKLLDLLFDEDDEEQNDKKS